MLNLKKFNVMKKILSLMVLAAAAVAMVSCCDAPKKAEACCSECAASAECAAPAPAAEAAPAAEVAPVEAPAETPAQ